MMENPGIHVLTDARWAELEPLIDEVRPPCKVPHANLRETIEAILWWHQNGAKWRSIPGELGPWWKAAQTPDQVRGRPSSAGRISGSGSACSTWSSSAGSPSA